eukprot:TRINITY_DN257_c0_g1_i2.p1 TRINITY_DN257_c0_g1~~TRINITY_DN257_c0_g1_i2.p1  ORF type:complete len:374 (-),score=111.46 TRINITY_DN257_c0_g1_i2:172-1293(-)
MSSLNSLMFPFRFVSMKNKHVFMLVLVQSFTLALSLAHGKKAHLEGVTYTKNKTPSTQEDFERLLEKQPVTNVDIGIGIVLAILGSGMFLPQIFEVVRSKSSIGVNPTTLFLASLTGAAGTTNIVLLDWFYLKSCSVVGSECLPHVMVASQMAAIFVAVSVTYIVVLYYAAKYDRPRLEQLEAQYANEGSGALEPVVACGLGSRAVWELVIFIVASLLFALVAIILMNTSGPGSDAVRGYAESCGLFNSIGTIFQWWPQVALTYQLKHKGTLSIAMLVFSGLVDVIGLVYLIRMHENWSACSSSVVDFIMISILLAMILKYEQLDAKRHHAAEGDDVSVAAAAAVAAAHNKHLDEEQSIASPHERKRLLDASA